MLLLHRCLQHDCGNRRLRPPRKRALGLSLMQPAPNSSALPRIPQRGLRICLKMRTSWHRVLLRPRSCQMCAARLPRPVAQRRRILPPHVLCPLRRPLSSLAMPGFHRRAAQPARAMAKARAAARRENRPTRWSLPIARGSPVRVPIAQALPVRAPMLELPVGPRFL